MSSRFTPVLTWADLPTQTTPWDKANIERHEVAIGAAYAGEGCVDLDEAQFTNLGTTDDQRLTSALTFCAAQTMRPWIRMPARRIQFATGGRVPYNGLKICGPNSPHNKNLEIEWTSTASAPVNHEIRLTCGNGASSWFVGPAAARYDVIVKDLAFYGNSTTQFWQQTAATLYSATFDSLTFYGLMAGIGSETSKALITQVMFAGHWSAISIAGTQFNLGGSDNALWMYGYLNMGTPGGAIANAGRPQIIIDSMSKTSVGYLYITLEADDDYSGLLLSGGTSFGGVTFFGGSFEGRGVTQPSMRAPIRVTGGNWTFVGGWYGQTSSASNALGVVEQTGGNIAMHSPHYMRSDATAVTFPFLYQTGGTAKIHDLLSMRSGEQARVRWADTTTVLAPLPVNVLD